MESLNGNKVSRLWVHIIVIPRSDIPYLNQLKLIGFDQFLRDSGLRISMIIEITSLQTDHLHCLLQVPPDRTIPNIASWIKSRTTQWLKIQGIKSPSPGWEQGYAAFSVSASVLPEVRKYIRNQFLMHNRRSFVDELDIWSIKYDPMLQYIL